jgi:hypothetical protein
MSIWIIPLYQIQVGVSLFSRTHVNKENHGFYFEEILTAFDDPFFLEAYDRKHSTIDEIRMNGLASL